MCVCTRVDWEGGTQHDGTPAPSTISGMNELYTHKHHGQGRISNENLPPPVASTKKRRATPTKKHYDTSHPPRQVPLTWGEHLPWRPCSPGKDHKRATATNNGAGRRYRNEYRKIRVMTSLVSSHHPARCGSDALGGLTAQSRPPLSAFPPNTSRDPRVLDQGLSGEIPTPSSSEITCTPSLSTTPASSGSLNLRSGSRWEHVPRCSNTDWARRQSVRAVHMALEVRT